MMDIDAAAAEAQYAFNLKWIEELRCILANRQDDAMTVQLGRALCSQAMAAYAMRREFDTMIPLVRESVSVFVPVLRRTLAQRTGPTACGYDPSALADFDFAWPFCLYVALLPRRDVIAVCDETDYGPYIGQPKLNSQEGSICRLIRALAMDKPQRISEELAALSALPGRSDPSHLSFGMTGRKWSEVFGAVVSCDSALLNSAVRAAVKWYYSGLEKKAKTATGYKYWAVLNPPLLAALRIAIHWQCIPLSVSDPVAPVKG